jgi:hypothetical protein
MAGVPDTAQMQSSSTRSWLWIDRSIVLFASAAVGYTLLSWMLAAVGAFDVLTASISIGLSVLFGLVVASRVRIASDAPEISRFSVLMLLVMIGFFVGWGVAHSGEHVITDRDPGVYSTAGLWLAAHGSLTIGFEEESAGMPDAFTNSSQGLVSIEDSELLQPGFMHGVIVWVATFAVFLGAASIFYMNALVWGAAAIILFFLALRLGFRRWALLVVALVLFNPIALFMTRDVYSEPVALLLIVCSVYCFVAAVVNGYPSSALYSVSGLAVGAVALFRIDGPAYLIGWSIAFLLVTVVRESAEDRGLVMMVPWIMAGSVAVVALILALGTAPSYIEAHSSRARPLWLLAAAVFAAALGATLIVSRNERFCQKLRSMLVSSTVRWFFVVTAIGLSLWFGVLRPLLMIDVGSPPSFIAGIATAELEGATPFALNTPVVDPMRTYYEQSALWQVRYWGIAVIASSLVAVVLVAIGRIRGRKRLALVAIGALLLPALVLYLQSPSITPDHFWAMRRYVPFSVPLFSILSVSLAVFLFRSFSSSRGNAPWRLLVGLFVVGVLVWVPISRATPLLYATEYVGFVGSIRRMCDRVPDDGAIVMVGTQYRDKLQGPVRSICNIPVVGAADGTSDNDVDQAVMAFRDSGRVPFVLVPIDREWDAPILLTDEFLYRITEWTVTEPPRRQVEIPYNWALYSVRG